ncbi:MAG: hypothetical protein WBD40_12430 [Tepidisphaeraceae bacterium]
MKLRVKEKPRTNVSMARAMSCAVSGMIWAESMLRPTFALRALFLAMLQPIEDRIQLGAKKLDRL